MRDLDTHDHRVLFITLSVTLAGVHVLISDVCNANADSAAATRLATMPAVPMSATTADAAATATAAAFCCARTPVLDFCERVLLGTKRCVDKWALIDTRQYLSIRAKLKDFALALQYLGMNTPLELTALVRQYLGGVQLWS